MPDDPTLIPGGAGTDPRSEPAIWVDVEDLFQYARANPRPSGIQRLAFEIGQSLRAELAGTGRLHFVRHAGRQQTPLLQEVPWEEVEHLFGRLAGRVGSQPAPTGRLYRRATRSRTSWLLAARHRLGFMALKMQPELGEPLLAAWFLQKDALRSLKALAGARRQESRAAFSSVPRRSLPRQGRAAPLCRDDIFLVLGAPWVHADYAGLLAALQEVHGLRVALLLYDLIPAVRPEWCARELVDSFRVWLETTLPRCDILLAISRYTVREVTEWASQAGVPLAGPVRPVPVGTGFGSAPARRGAQSGSSARPPGLPASGSYVLFVSTLEARKNHALLVRVWRALLDEERSGQRPRGSVPDLVFAGRVGWLTADLLQQLDNTSWLGGRLRLVRDPTDAELRALYEGCLFSLFPSWHEGWGLPVAEALAFGVPVLCSSAGALPEAGRDLARYFDPGDTASCRRAVAALLDDPEELAAWRADVQNRFEPTPWSATARALLEALPGTETKAAAEAMG